MQSKIDKFYCKLDGCWSKAKARGYCHKHYQQWLRHGNPRVIIPNIKVCYVDGCNSIATRMVGMCNIHYRQILKYGETVDYNERKCERCGSDYYAKNLCRSCYHREYNKKNWRKYK